MHVIEAKNNNPLGIVSNQVNLITMAINITRCKEQNIISSICKFPLKQNPSSKGHRRKNFFLPQRNNFEDKKEKVL